MISLLSKGLYDLNYRLKVLSPKTVTWGLGVRLQHFVCLVAQFCPSLYDPMDSGPPGSFVHGDSPVFLPEESPWTEESGGLQYTESRRVRHHLATDTRLLLLAFRNRPWKSLFLLFLFFKVAVVFSV